MNTLEEAIIYATTKHQGKHRLFSGIPFILHPLEVAQILSTMTEDQEVITAGILHDILENTDGTPEEIKDRFGERVASLVFSETEEVYPDEPLDATWQRRKEGSLISLMNSRDIGVKMLWLADKLANIRSIARRYSERGEAMWKEFNQTDPAMHCWYYKTVAETVELDLNKTGAFKEYIKHINFLWPGTFDSGKARYRKYKEVSIEGCRMMGRGAKGDVYRYNDELIIKVFNHNNTYQDVEREIALSRRAFILGIPTAISFGIVSVGDRYGALYELVDGNTVSHYIAWAPQQVDAYAKIMAELARKIHTTEITGEDVFPESSERLLYYINDGLGGEHEELAEKCRKLVTSLPESNTLVHGDFHTGNVFMQNGETILIDMDRISRGHPVVELGDLHYFYVALGEDDPSVVEKFMGFSYPVAQRFFNVFLKNYLNTGDEEKIREVTEKLSLLSNIRTLCRLRHVEKQAEEDIMIRERSLKRIRELTGKLDRLDF